MFSNIKSEVLGIKVNITSSQSNQSNSYSIPTQNSPSQNTNIQSTQSAYPILTSTPLNTSNSVSANANDILSTPVPNPPITLNSSMSTPFTLETTISNYSNTSSANSIDGCSNRYPHHDVPLQNVDHINDGHLLSAFDEACLQALEAAIGTKSRAWSDISSYETPISNEILAIESLVASDSISSKENDLILT